MKSNSNRNDVLYALKDLRHDFHELTHGYKVIDDAINEIQSLRIRNEELRGSVDGYQRLLANGVK